MKISNTEEILVTVTKWRNYNVIITERKLWKIGQNSAITKYTTLKTTTFQFQFNFCEQNFDFKIILSLRANLLKIEQRILKYYKFDIKLPGYVFQS